VGCRLTRIQPACILLLLEALPIVSFHGDILVKAPIAGRFIIEWRSWKSAFIISSQIVFVVVLHF